MTANTRTFDLNIAMPEEPLGDRITRLGFAHQFVGRFATDMRSRMQYQPYQGPDGEHVTELTLVIRVILNPGAEPDTDPADYFLGRVAELSAILEQECIAVHHLASNTGHLCGPYADRWGDFNSEFFIPFN